MTESDSHFVIQTGGYSLLQCRPCLVGDYICIAAGNSIRVYSGKASKLSRHSKQRLQSTDNFLRKSGYKVKRKISENASLRKQSLGKLVTSESIS